MPLLKNYSILISLHGDIKNNIIVYKIDLKMQIT